jgi:hypothetical protein
MTQTPPEMTPAPFLPFADVVEEWVDQWFGLLGTLLDAQRTMIKAAAGAAVSSPTAGLVPMSPRLVAQTADERTPVRT